MAAASDPWKPLSMRISIFCDGVTCLLHTKADRASVGEICRCQNGRGLSAVMRLVGPWHA